MFKELFPIYAEDYNQRARFDKSPLPTNNEGDFADTDLIYNTTGTPHNKKQTITNGGRVLNIVIREKTLESAIFKGYNLIKKIKCSNIFFRNDIGS